MNNLLLNEKNKPSLFTRLCAIVYISSYGFNKLDIVTSLSNILNESPDVVIKELENMKKLNMIDFEIITEKTDD